MKNPTIIEQYIIYISRIYKDCTLTQPLTLTNLSTERRKVPHSHESLIMYPCTTDHCTTDPCTTDPRTTDSCTTEREGEREGEKEGETLTNLS